MRPTEADITERAELDAAWDHLAFAMDRLTTYAVKGGDTKLDDLVIDLLRGYVDAMERLRKAITPPA